jgi:hypothetical protein
MRAQVPDNLSALVNLRTLILGLKVVKAVPEPLLALTRLEQLAITFCRLARAPPALARMRHLRELNLKGNSGLIVRAPSLGFSHSPCHAFYCTPLWPFKDNVLVQSIQTAQVDSNIAA